MRGDTKDEIPVVLQKRKGLAWGVLIDPSGEVQGHIISTKWHNLIIVGFFLMLILIAILLSLVLINRFQMDDFEQRLKQEEITVGT